LRGTVNAEVHLIKAFALFQLQHFEESTYEAQAAMALIATAFAPDWRNTY